MRSLESSEAIPVNHRVRGSSPCWGAKQNRGLQSSVCKPLLLFQPYFQPSAQNQVLSGRNPWSFRLLMERSFAQASRFGFDRARWRRLWRVQIQEYLVAAVQNIRILTTHFKEQRKVKVMRVAVPPAKQNLPSNSTPDGLCEYLLHYLQSAYSNQRQCYGRFVANV